MSRREGQTAEQEAEAIASIGDSLRGVIARIKTELGEDVAFDDAKAAIGRVRSNLLAYLSQQHP